MEFSVSLKKNHEFRRLYSKGKSAAMPAMVVYCRRRRGGLNRVGITVSTKLGKAVRRNRVRRRLREVYRLNESRLIRGLDVVIVARMKSRCADFRELEREFLAACGKLGILA